MATENNHHTLSSEQAWLKQLESGQVLGICLLDAQGHVIQRFDLDPEFREGLLEQQRDRVRQLALSQ